MTHDKYIQYINELLRKDNLFIIDYIMRKGEDLDFIDKYQYVSSINRR